MTRKPGIVAHLGEESLLLPRAVGEALEACERATYRLALLDAACIQDPESASGRLDALRESLSGAADEEARWAGLLAGAERLDDGSSRVPRVGELVAAVREDLAEMLTPLRYGDELATARYARRLDGLAADAPDFAAHALSPRQRDRALGAPPSGTTAVAAFDSLARLTADLCGELAELRRGLAKEPIHGATGYRLAGHDRPLVERFMTGVEAAPPPANRHPALDTIAVRHGRRLVIENELGSADAQVLLVGVDERDVSLTYTDVHRERVRAFRGHLDAFPVQWHELHRRPIQGLGVRDHYFLLAGRFLAATGKELDRFLEHLGSRLVHLLDEPRKPVRRLPQRPAGPRAGSRRARLAAS